MLCSLFSLLRSHGGVDCFQRGVELSVEFLSRDPMVTNCCGSQPPIPLRILPQRLDLGADLLALGSQIENPLWIALHFMTHPLRHPSHTDQWFVGHHSPPLLDRAASRASRSTSARSFLTSARASSPSFASTSAPRL